MFKTLLSFYKQISGRLFENAVKLKSVYLSDLFSLNHFIVFSENKQIHSLMLQHIQKVWQKQNGAKKSIKRQVRPFCMIPKFAG